MVEVRQLEDRRRGEGTLQLLERRVGVLVPHEVVLCQQARERRGDSAIPLDEVPVVPCEAKKAAQRSNRTWACPVRHRLDLLGAHGHSFRRDDMP